MLHAVSSPLPATVTLEGVLDRVVDPEFGLIRYVSEIPVQSGEPDIFIAVAEYANPLETPPRAGSGRTRFYNRQSAGAGLDRQSTLWATVGEALERYAGMLYDPSAVVMAKADDLVGRPHIPPEAFILFSEEQRSQTDFPFARHDPAKSIGWVPGRRLRDDAEFLLPAALVYMAYEAGGPHEFFGDVYSTGLAIGPDMSWAASTALRETLERDCFGLHWATRTSPRRIDIEVIAERIGGSFARLCRHPGVDLFVGDMTTELGIPGVLSVVRPHHHSGIALGASCHPCPAVAVEKAVVESFHTFNWLIEMRRWPREITPDALREFADHVRLHMEPAWTPQAAFLWQADTPSPLFNTEEAFERCTPAEELTALEAALTTHGHDAYLIDVTPADIADLNLVACRAVAPSLQPLWAGSGRAGLDRRRIEAFLAATGRKTDLPVNTDPHPFP